MEARRYTPLHEGMVVRWAALVAAQRHIALPDNSGPVRVVEIGVGSGVTANEIAHDLTRRGVEYSYTGVDSMVEDATEAINLRWARMALIKGDSTDPAIIANVPDEIHFLFVDGDHSYSGVRADVDNYGPRVRVGFLMGMHDIGRTGARRVLAELLDTGEWGLLLRSYERISSDDLTPGIAVVEKLR